MKETLSENRKRKILQVQIHAGLTHVCRQIVYNYINKKSQKSSYSRRDKTIQSGQNWMQLCSLPQARDHMSCTKNGLLLFTQVRESSIQIVLMYISSVGSQLSSRMRKNFIPHDIPPGGRSLFVWLAVGHFGRTIIVFLDSSQNHKDQIGLLEFELLSHGTKLGEGDQIVQQDGAAIRTAIAFKNWFTHIRSVFCHGELKTLR